MNGKDLTEIIRSAQKGDVGAFKQIYAEYERSIYFIAFKLLGNQQDAEEVTQDVFLYIHGKISELKDPQAFSAWISRITTSKCTDHLRKNNRFSGYVDETSDIEFIEETDPDLIPEKSLDNEATAQIIIDIIDKLPLQQRICIYYYYYERLTVREIAEQLEVKETTVKNRLALARDKIRRELEKLEDEEGIRLYSAFPLFLVRLFRSAAEKTEVPHGMLSEVMTNIGAGSAGTTGTMSTGAALAAKTGTGLKMLALAAAGTAAAGGIIIGIALSNSKLDIIDSLENGLEEPPAIETSIDYSDEEAETLGYNNISAETAETEPEEPEAEEVKVNLFSLGVTDESLAEMVADGTIPSNVTVLNLYDNHELNDLSPLSSLTELRELDLRNTNTATRNAGMDLSPLSGLTNLTYLNLERANIISIAPLSGLTNLTHLDLKYNEISDISDLSGLTELTYLDLSHYPRAPKRDRITDISPLQNMTKLEYLQLYEHNITDISVLAGMENLTYLYIAQNDISDISVLSGLTNLTELSFWGNEIEDISPLSGLTNLTSLSMSSNNISDISPIFGLTGLTHMSITRNPVSDEQIEAYKAINPDCWFTSP